MQAYDLIMIIVLACATILGAIKGFAWQVASLASIVVSYLVAVNFRFDLAKMIQAAPPWNMFLAMLILYVGTSFVIWVAFRLLSGVIDGVRLKEFDRHLGAAFGLAKGALFCLLITMFAMTLLGPKQQEAICQSRSGYYIASALDNASGILPKEIHDVVGPYLARLDEKLHQQFPAGGQATAGGGGGLWPSSWGSGAAAPGAQPVGGAGSGFGSGFGGAAVPEQGSGGGFNFWPGGQAPAAPTQVPIPQNMPLAPPSLPGSFGGGDIFPPAGAQQAQFPPGFEVR